MRPHPALVRRPCAAIIKPMMNPTIRSSGGGAVGIYISRPILKSALILVKLVVVFDLLDATEDLIVFTLFLNVLVLLRALVQCALTLAALRRPPRVCCRNQRRKPRQGVWPPARKTSSAATSSPPR